MPGCRARRPRSKPVRGWDRPCAGPAIGKRVRLPADARKHDVALAKPDCSRRSPRTPCRLHHPADRHRRRIDGHRSCARDIGSSDSQMVRSRTCPRRAPVSHDPRRGNPTPGLADGEKPERRVLRIGPCLFLRFSLFCHCEPAKQSNLLEPYGLLRCARNDIQVL